MADGLFGSMLPGAVSAYGIYDLMENLQDQRGDIRKFLGMGNVSDLLGYTQEQGGFQPFSLRGGGIAPIDFGPDGRMSIGPLTDRQKSIRRQMFNQGQDLLAQAAVDPTQRTEDIYGRMMAAQQPEINRLRQNTQGALFGGGRSGIRSAQYGGAPESLAMEKALAEQRDKSYIASMNQALGEQAQQAQLGRGMLEQGYRPLQMAMDKAKLGLGYGNMMQQANQGMMNNYLNLALGGLGTDVNLQNIKAGLLGQLYAAGADAAGGVGGWLDDILGL